MLSEIAQHLNTGPVLPHTFYYTICLFSLSSPLILFCLVTPCNLTLRTLHGMVVESSQLPLLSMFTSFYLPYSLVLLLFNIAVIWFLDFSAVLDLWKLAGWIAWFSVFTVYLPLDLTICSYLAVQVNEFFSTSCSYLDCLFPLSPDIIKKDLVACLELMNVTEIFMLDCVLQGLLNEEEVGIFLSLEFTLPNASSWSIVQWHPQS